MIEFAVMQTMDLEAWKDHVLGSGAFRWDWWVEVNEFENSLEVWWYDNVDSAGSSMSHKTLTYQQLADKCSELARTNTFVANQLLNDDFDADGMDQVLQYAFIGEIRYG